MTKAKIKIFKRKQPKYGIGDKVRFVDRNVLDNDSVWIGRIWKIHTYLLCEPSYEVFYSSVFGLGDNFCVSESDIIEVLYKGDGTAKDPFQPIKL